MKFDAIRDVCTDAVHDGRTEMIAVRDERTVYADRDDRTEEMMKNAVRDGRTEKSTRDVYDDVGTDGTILESVDYALFISLIYIEKVWFLMYVRCAYACVEHPICNL